MSMETKPRIPYTQPSITEQEVRYATCAAANGWGAHCYDYIHRFGRSKAMCSRAWCSSPCAGSSVTSRWSIWSG
jgi:perosamine synthetase